LTDSLRAVEVSEITEGKSRKQAKTNNLRFLSGAYGTSYLIGSVERKAQ
jgi:hypothetical protein